MNTTDRLVMAVAAGDLEATREALLAGASPDATHGYEESWDRERMAGEQTVLQRAARDGHTAIVGELLSRGADPNLRDTLRGRTPLVEAAARGDLEIVTMLLGAGAAIATDPARGEGDALVASIQGGHVRVAEALVAAGATATPLALELASHRSDAHLADLCLHSGADAADPQALIGAARAGNVAAIRRLVAGGADLAAAGGEALCEAANAGKHEAAALLLSLGVSPGFRNSYGWVPLHFAAYQADAALCEILLRAGADPRALDDAGRSASDWANEAGRPENLAAIARAMPGA